MMKHRPFTQLLLNQGGDAETFHFNLYVIKPSRLTGLPGGHEVVQPVAPSS